MSTDRVIAELQLQYQQFNTGMKDVITQLGTLEGKVDTSFAKLSTESVDAFNKMKAAANGLNLEALSNRLSDLREVASTAFTTPIVAAGGFEKKLLGVQAISGATDDQIAALASQLRNVGKELDIAVKPADAAATQYEILSSGFTSVAESSKVLEAALKLTGDGTTGSADAARALTGSLNAYGASADQAAKYTDILFKTQDVGVTTVGELSASLGQVVSISAQAGVSFEELNAAIATATLSGQSTSTAIAGIRGTITTLLKPTAEAEKTMAKLGITINSTTLKNDGLLKTLQKIRTATAGNNEDFVKIIGSAEAMGTSLALVGDGGAKFADALDQISNAAGSADKFNEIMGKGFETTQAKFEAAKDSFITGVGQEVLPFATKFLQAGTGLIGVLDKIPGPIKAAAVGLAGLALAGTSAVAAFVAYQAVSAQVGIALVEMGTRGAALASGAIKLLTTEIVFGTGATATNTGAIGLNTVATDLMAAAKGRAAAANALLSQSALASRLALLGVVGAIALLGLGIQKTIEEYEKLYEETDKLTNLEAKRLAGGNKQKDIVGKTAQELRDMGKTSKDVGDAIASMSEQVEAARATGDQAMAERFQGRLNELRKQRSELARLEEQDAARKGTAAAPTTSPVVLDKKKAEQDFRDAKQLIDISDEGHAKKLEQLKQLRDANYALLEGDRELRRSLNADILREEKALNKQKADDAKKARAEVLKDEIQKVDNSNDPDAKRREGLQKLLVKYKDNGEARRAIEDRIFKIETDQQKAREDRIQKLAQLKADAAAREAQELDARKAKLDELEDRGVDTSAAKNAIVGEQRTKRIEEIDVRLEGDLAKEKDSDVRAALKKAALAEKAAIEREAAEEAERIQRDNNQRIIGLEQDLASRQGSILSNKIDLLKQQAEAGKNVEFSLREAIEQRLRLQEREIELQAKLAKSQTEDPRQIALIEEEAQGKIRSARAAANAELDKAKKLQDAQKKGSKEFGGDILTLDQFVQGERDRFAGKPAAESAANIKDVFNTAEIDRKYLNSAALKPEQLTGAFASAAMGPLAVRTEIVLVNDKGEDIPFEIRRVTVNGKNSTEATKSRGATRGAF